MVQFYKRKILVELGVYAPAPPKVLGNVMLCHIHDAGHAVHCLNSIRSLPINEMLYGTVCLPIS